MRRVIHFILAEGGIDINAQVVDQFAMSLMSQKAQSIIVYSDEANMINGNRQNGELALPMKVPILGEEIEACLMAQVPTQPTHPLFGGYHILLNAPEYH